MAGILKTRAALYVVCIARAGYVDGARLIEFIEEWRRCVDDFGREVTVTEFIGWTRRYHQRRTVERRVRVFRETFPQLGPQGLPTGLMQPLLERLARDVEATS